MNYQFDLVLSHDVDSNGEAKNFDWKDYCELTSFPAAIEEFLFPHHNFMCMTVFEVIFSPGKYLFVRHGENGIRFGKIECSVSHEVLVEFQDVVTPDSDFFPIEDVISDKEEFEKLKKNQLNGFAVELEFVDVDLIKKYDGKWERTIGEMIEVGSYFELQDPCFPQSVTIAKVLENYNGMVIATVFGDGTERVLHMAEPHCHALGWAASGVQKVDLHPFYTEEMMEEYRAKAVDSIVFERFALPEIRWKRGQFVEVLEEGGQFVSPGYVYCLHNDHYAEIRVYGPHEKEPSRMIVNDHEKGIYPAQSPAAREVVFADPKLMSDNGLHPFTWDSFKQFYRLHSTLKPLIQESAPLLPKKNARPMTFVEVFSYTQGIMTMGMITRCTRDMVYIHLGINGAGKAIPYPIGSYKIFPIGFAQEHDIPFIAEKPFFTLADYNSDEGRFEMKKHFRSAPGPVFRPYSYSGRGRPEKRWNFAPESWLNGDKWVPPIHIRRTCKLGEWFDAEKYAALRDTYPGGNLTEVLGYVALDFILCAKSVYKNEVTNVLHTDEMVPIMILKHRWRFTHSSLMKCPAPEKARQVCGWLRAVLKCLGCCPSLLTLDLSKPCMDNCCDLPAPEPFSSSYTSPQKRNSTGEGKGGNKRRRRDDKKDEKKDGRKEGRKQKRRTDNSDGSPLSVLSRTDGAVEGDELSMEGLDLEARKAHKTHAYRYDKNMPSDYTKWTRMQITDYLLNTNPTMKHIVSQLMFSTKPNQTISAEKLLTFNDAKEIMEFGFSRNDAKALLGMLNKMRSTLGPKVDQ